MMTLIRCTCGQALGKVEGQYEFRCHKCKKIVKGVAADGMIFHNAIVKPLDAIAGVSCKVSTSP